jgi:hypothetical protein
MIDMPKAMGLVHGAAADGAREWLEDVLALSQEQVPVATGLLKSTGASDFDRATMKGAVWYDTDYAVPVHEDLKDKHPTGKAKYLEDPTQFMVPLLIRGYLARYVEARLAGRGTNT